MVVLFTSTIERGTCKKLLDHVVSAKGRFSEVRIAISSHGGEMDESFLIYDTLRGLGAPTITTHNIGFVNSAAIVLYMAGERRLAVENATFMLHAAAYEQARWERMTVDRMKTVAEGLAKLDERLRVVLTTDADISAEMLAASSRSDQTIPAQLARDWKIVTEDFVPFETAAADEVVVL